MLSLSPGARRVELIGDLRPTVSAARRDATAREGVSGVVLAGPALEIVKTAADVERVAVAFATTCRGIAVAEEKGAT